MTTDDQNDFQYGLAHTDIKTGKHIVQGRRTVDYFKDPAYEPIVRAMLKKIGIRHPEENEIFRGSFHDMLFIHSHGVVIKIGKIDVADLVNPAILQPLGWLDNEKTGITMAIYPGIEHIVNYKGDKSIIENLTDYFNFVGQASQDVNARNIGIIRVMEDDLETVAALLLDSDNKFNKTIHEYRKQLKSETALSCKLGEIKSEPIQAIMNAAYERDDYSTAYWKAFNVHQPLRTLFHYAQSTTDPDLQRTRMNYFWKRCRQLTLRPERIIQHDWSKNEYGHDIKNQETIDTLALYTHWTEHNDFPVYRSAERKEWRNYIDHIEADPENFKALPQHLKNHKGFVFLAAQAEPRILEYAPDFRNDLDFMLKLIDHTKWAVTQVPAEFLNNLETVKKIYEITSFAYCEWTIKNIVPQLQDNISLLNDCLYWKNSPAYYLCKKIDFNKMAQENSEEELKKIGLRLFQTLPNGLEAAFFEAFPKQIYGQKDFIFKAIEINKRKNTLECEFLKYLPDDLQTTDIVRHTLNVYGARNMLNLMDFAPHIRDNVDFTLELLKENLVHLRSIKNPVLKENKKFVLEAINIEADFTAINFMSQTFYDDLDVMQKLIEKNGIYLKHVGNKIKSDPQKILPLVNNRKVTFLHLPEDLKQDYDFLKKWHEQRPEISNDPHLKMQVTYFVSHGEEDFIKKPPAPVNRQSAPRQPTIRP